MTRLLYGLCKKRQGIWYINSMKKIYLPLIVIPFLLAGCFGSSDSSTALDKKIEGFHSYSTGEFSMQIPDEWEVITLEKFQSNVPKNTLIAFRNNVKDEKFTANVVVIKNDLSQEQEISSLDYAKSLHQKMSQDLSNYIEIAVEQMKIFADNKENETIFLYAVGREQPESDLKKFMQISGIKGKTAYIALGSMLSTESETNTVLTDKIITMIKSFEVK